MEELSFYLRDASVKYCIDNSILFLEVDVVDYFWVAFLALDLPTEYATVHHVPIEEYDWKKCFTQDPAVFYGKLENLISKRISS